MTAAAHAPDIARSPLHAHSAVEALDLDLSLIETRAGFDRLEEEWNALFERSASGSQIFQTFNWNWHWANHYLPESPGGLEGLRLSIITGRRDGRLVMVWPLVSQRLRGITQIFWMGEPVSQYGDVLIDNIGDAKNVLRAGWNFLSRTIKADLVRLRRVRADANVASILRETGATVTDRQVAPYLDIASAKSFAEYEQRYSPRSRRNRRRLARRLEELGGMRFERHKGGMDARALAEKALDLKAEWLKDRGLVSGAIGDSRMRRFFGDIAEARERPADCVVAALYAENEPAALDVSFLCKGRLAMHVIVFNLKYEKSGAGVLLLEESFRNAYKDSIAVYDMLAPGDKYKIDWADGTVEVLDWARPFSVSGYAYARLYLGFLRARAKAAIGAMPERLRRVLTSGYATTANVN